MSKAYDDYAVAVKAMHEAELVFRATVAEAQKPLQKAQEEAQAALEKLNAEIRGVTTVEQLPKA